MITRRGLAALAALALLAGACTRADGETEVGAASSPQPASDTGAETSADGGAEQGGSRLDRGAFGELEEVCWDGEPGESTEVGLTADEIRLGLVTDRGSAERPGLNQEMYDAAVAFANWCNEHGGIGGRQVVVDDLDAKLFEYGQRVAEACQQDFALVGGGAVFDSQDNGARVDCGLINIPGYAVTPQARAADLQVQPVPNPVYSMATSGYRWIQEAPTPTASASCGSTSTARPPSTTRSSRWSSPSASTSSSTSSTAPSARRAGGATCRRCATRASRSSR